MKESIKTYGNVTGHSIGFAQYAPKVGFAAALKEFTDGGQPDVEDEKKFTKKQTASNGMKVDKEQARLHERPTGVRKLPTLAVGRKANLAKRGNDWRPFLEKLQQHNRRLGSAVAATQLILKYVTDTEMDGMLAERFPEGRPISSGKEHGQVRALVNEMNAFSGREQAADVARERKLLSGSPASAQATMERILDPDNPKWFAEDDTLPALVERENISAWLPADFYAANIGRSAMSTVTVELEDASLVLARGRDRFVDAMGSKFGFDTTNVSSAWRPEVDIFHTVGGA